MSQKVQPNSTSSHAAQQGALWGERAADWAEHEADNWTLFEHAQQATLVAPGKRLLDVACGAGFGLSRAAARGAVPSGLDASAALIELARRRVPAADLRIGDMEMLPYADESFDVVTGINAFQYAASPVRALREARRVTRSGGLLAIVTWGAPQESDVTAYFQALAALLPAPASGGAQGPFALPEAGRLSVLVAEAGWSPLAMSDVPVHWHWPDEAVAMRRLLSAGPTASAARSVGFEAVREVARRVLARFRAADGYRLRNKFRCLIARR